MSFDSKFLLKRNLLPYTGDSNTIFFGNIFPSLRPLDDSFNYSHTLHRRRGDSQRGQLSQHYSHSDDDLISDYISSVNFPQEAPPVPVTGHSPGVVFPPKQLKRHLSTLPSFLHAVTPKN